MDNTTIREELLRATEYQLRCSISDNDYYASCSISDQKRIIREIIDALIDKTATAIRVDFNRVNLRNPESASIFSSEVFRLTEILPLIEINLSRSVMHESAGKIVSMNTMELIPDLYRDEVLEIEIREKQKIDIKTSTLYRCKKCGKNETTFKEYQGRASDEASSLRIICVNCKYSWHT